MTLSTSKSSLFLYKTSDSWQQDTKWTTVTNPAFTWGEVIRITDHFAGLGSSQSRHFKYGKYQYSSFEFMVTNPPVSSKKERKQARQLKPYQFWGKTNAKNGPRNVTFPRPEGRVSCSWSSPPEFLQKSYVRSDWSEQRDPSQLSGSL